MTDITIKDLQELIHYFSKNTYQAKNADSTSQAIMQRCILLADLDYTHTIISNKNGDLSDHYPSHLIILEYEKQHSLNNCDTPPPIQRTTETIYESNHDPSKLKTIMTSAKTARCRKRFPLPVILYKGRNVCRSATLSGGPEIYGRSGYEYFFPNPEEVDKSNEVDDAASSPMSEMQLFDKYRKRDIKLLKALHVGTIVDFMVEKKKVKFGLNVTSSEKVDKEQRYSEFTIVSLPYPGCEFFKEFRGNDYAGNGLVYDWNQTHVDAEIGIPDDPISTQLHINWELYQHWDLISLTKNYLKLILRYLNDSSNGMLIHCISGWDRTPLFISLLRISLWADGMIHTSLNAQQLLYFTVAYDWMLFGHDLNDRLSKHEEIFYFCFYFLKYIGEDEFSVNKRLGSKHTVRNDSDCQLDNAMFDTDAAAPSLIAVSSNLSLNSCCSNNSQNSFNSRDSQDNNPPVFHCTAVDGLEDVATNGNVTTSWANYYSSQNKENSTGSRSPLPSSNKRTSPVAVPSVQGRLRQRNESSSSNGSWQMISATGSLHSNADTACSSQAFGRDAATASQANNESSTTLVEEDNFPSPPPTKRQIRLENLRQMFYTVYTQTVGLQMKNNSESTGLSSLLENVAEKFVLFTSQRTSL
ncbi:myotubularin-related protein 14 [Trichogramma pretiosum]|uniref:myotubularin-related protein 14 n=1 Tax=Trichogramma pretiosum TaxID=7493 RepID=UPI0006C98F9A|nr:myotubularin-related protein 14 [Trichogramma pretiosum]XP_023318169.1 myotubularin-related protein 14 [Trichogramma pretiosum]